MVVGFIFQGAEGIATTIPHKLLHQVGIVIQLRIGDDRVRVAHKYLLTLGIDAVDERPQPTSRIQVPVRSADFETRALRACAATGSLDTSTGWYKSTCIRV